MYVDLGHLLWLKKKGPYRIDCLILVCSFRWRTLPMRTWMCSLVPALTRPTFVLSGTIATKAVCRWATSLNSPTMYTCLDLFKLGENGRPFADDIFKCLFWMKIIVCLFKFYWCLFPVFHLTITRHWVMQWLFAWSLWPLPEPIWTQI